MLEFFGIPVGSIAQVGTFALVLIALIGAYVKLKDRGMTHAEVMCGRLSINVEQLRKELHDCEENCREDIKKLNEELFGMRRQNIAEQISFINVLLRSVNSPDLHILLRTLENVQGSLVQAKILTEEGEANVKGS